MVKPVPQLGRGIQILREKRRMTVQELADRAGTTYQSIWRIERGAQLDPSVGLIKGIARALGVGVDHLVNMFGEDADDGEMLPTALALAGREA